MDYRKQPMVEEKPEGTQEDHSKGGLGRLPGRAPLANPFVPFQEENPPTYTAKNGTVRGTLFPGLDLPFLGMINEKPLPESALHELQELCFALVELGEYLDTHPEDREVFELFRTYAELYGKGKQAYEKEFGPLTLEGAARDEAYRWMKDPWPWDFQEKKEG